MKKWLKITLIAVGGLVVALIAALQILLRSRVVTNLIDKYVSEYVDGELAYSDLDISLFKSFPGIRLTDVQLHNLALYAHDFGDDAN